MPRLTKIICTISDLNCSPAFIHSLYQAGMNAVRLNTAHQSVSSTEKIIHNIRQVSQDIAIILDTKGAEMRTCGLDGEPGLVKGQTVTVVSGRQPRPAAAEFAVNTPLFVKNIPLLATVVLDEGKIILEVCNKEPDRVQCRVVRGGILTNRRAVNVPGVDMGLPGITEQDRAYIDLAIKTKIDYIAHSFVRNRQDVLNMQQALLQAGSSARVIAKIENRDGINNLPEILDSAWGILIARGDLGIEIPAAQVPQVQKSIIRQCRLAGKPVILATHILASMTGNIRPTQAEISDVANAVVDGVDALTLTGETAEGNYPVETTQTLDELCRYTETWQDENSAILEQLPEGDPHYMAALYPALEAAANKSIVAIIDETNSGIAAGLLAAARCSIPIFRRCASLAEKRNFVLLYGVFPFVDVHDKFLNNTLRPGKEKPVAVTSSTLETGIIVKFISTAELNF